MALNKNLMRLLPLLLIVGGVLVTIGAFLLYAGNSLPYPDSTPELLAYQAATAKEGNLIMGGGFLSVVVGVVWSMRRSRKRRRKS